MVTLTHHKKSVRTIAIHPTEYSFTFSSAGGNNIKKWKYPAGAFVFCGPQCDHQYALGRYQGWSFSLAAVNRSSALPHTIIAHLNVSFKVCRDFHENNAQWNWLRSNCTCFTCQVVTRFLMVSVGRVICVKNPPCEASLSLSLTPQDVHAAERTRPVCAFPPDH